MVGELIDLTMDNEFARYDMPEELGLKPWTEQVQYNQSQKSASFAYAPINIPPFGGTDLLEELMRLGDWRNNDARTRAQFLRNPTMEDIIIDEGLYERTFAASCYRCGKKTNAFTEGKYDCCMKCEDDMDREEYNMLGDNNPNYNKRRW